MTNEETKALYELEAEIYELEEKIERLRAAVSTLAAALWILVPLGAVAVACALGHCFFGLSSCAARGTGQTSSLIETYGV